MVFGWLVFGGDISRSLNLYDSFQVDFYNIVKLADLVRFPNPLAVGSDFPSNFPKSGGGPV